MFFATNSEIVQQPQKENLVNLSCAVRGDNWLKTSVLPHNKQSERAGIEPSSSYSTSEHSID